LKVELRSSSQCIAENLELSSLAKNLLIDCKSIMAGRGRGRVLPAWMTSGKHAVELASAKAGNDANPAGCSTPGAVPGNLSSGSPSSTDAQGTKPATAGMPPPLSKPATQGGYVSNPRARPKPLPLRPKNVGGWAEHKTDDGKVYYFNSITGQSQFVKPDMMKSEIEKALPSCVWKQFIKDGKSYYFNQQTQQSVWDQPMAFTTFKERLRVLCEGDAPTKDTFR
jgi:YHS domain-containing protein